jgi:hypothetical protein
MNHSLHFTYEPPNQPDLLQGDVIQKTTEILALIKEVHPHYLRDDYTHLMITTQSCDLVRRGSEKTTNSRYITLVAVRPFETALERELAKYQKSDIEAHSICGMKTKTKIVDFAKSLLNNNREDFFYLHEEPSLNFSNSCCAFLRLPISIRCKDHYEKCL